MDSYLRDTTLDDLEEKIADGPRGAQIEERIQLGIELSLPSSEDAKRTE